MGKSPIPLARRRPEQAERDPLDEIIPLNPRLIGPLVPSSPGWFRTFFDNLTRGFRVIGATIIPEPAKPDYSLLKGVRAYGYQPSSPAPEQNPPQSVSGVIPIAWAADRITPSWARSEYVIDDLSLVGQLRTNGFRCEQQRTDSLAWWDTDLPPLGHNETLTLKNGTTIMREGTTLNYGAQWGVSLQEAADALTNAFGGQSNRALLTLMKTIESEISPERIDGIEPCGYEEL